jgi:hypothetical protein
MKGFKKNNLFKEASENFVFDFVAQQAAKHFEIIGAYSESNV